MNYVEAVWSVLIFKFKHFIEKIKCQQKGKPFSPVRVIYAETVGSSNELDRF
jgi:hypothetical protein